MSFENSNCFQEVKQLLGTFVLRGQAVKNIKKANCLNKPFVAHSSVQVMNILGFALNIPIAPEHQDTTTTCNYALEQGNTYIFEHTYKEQLEELVGKMKTKRFVLVPLAVVYMSKGKLNMHQTFVIKVYPACPYNSYSYVDTLGRIYNNFQQFLSNNKLPLSRLCYPKNCVISFDKNDEIELDYCEVGTKNEKLKHADVFMGILGAIGGIGSIVATGGMSTPMVLSVLGSCGYGAFRGIGSLIDASEHGMSLHPFKNEEARMHWLSVAANLAAFASYGFRLVPKGARNGSMCFATRSAEYLSAGFVTVRMVNSFIYSVNHWKTLSPGDKIHLACAICFSMRVVIGLTYTEQWIRNAQLDGVCDYFSTLSPMYNMKQFFAANDTFLENGLKMIQYILENHVSVTSDEEFTKFTFFGYEYKTKFVLSLPGGGLAKFIFMLKGIAARFVDIFSISRRMFGDDKIFNVVSKRGDELGGHEHDYGNAINQLMQVFKLIFAISNDITILTEQELILGAGHRFTLKYAFIIFVTIAQTKAFSLLNALLELDKSETTKLNKFRDIYPQEIFFRWIIADCNGSAEILARTRFILKFQDICIEKQLHITKFHVGKAAVEIEGIMCIDLQLFSGASHSAYLVDPRYFRLLKAVQEQAPRKYLENLWEKTCVPKEPLNKSFEKLDSLGKKFKIYPDSIANVISYAQRMQCSNFIQFFYHSLFAFNNIERLMILKGLDEMSANSDLFSDDSQLLASSFNTLKEKAAEFSLEGYSSIEESQSMDQAELLEIIKNQAKEKLLRFGPIENAVLHLEKYPTLRLKREIHKLNCFIAVKKFSLVETHNVDGKCIFLMNNDQMRIEVGVVHGMGSYIDDFSLTANNRSE